MESGVKGKRPNPPTQAEPGTMFMVECLENFIMNPLTWLVAKHPTAAYLFCFYYDAVMRMEQAQSCWIDTVRDKEAFVEGYFFLDKNPRRAKLQPRPWWAPLYGLTGTKLWFETLFGSLQKKFQTSTIFPALSPAQMVCPKRHQSFTRPTPSGTWFDGSPARSTVYGLWFHCRTESCIQSAQSSSFPSWSGGSSRRACHMLVQNWKMEPKRGSTFIFETRNQYGAQK